MQDRATNRAPPPGRRAAVLPLVGAAYRKFPVPREKISNIFAKGGPEGLAYYLI